MNRILSVALIALLLVLGGCTLRRGLAEAEAAPQAAAAPSEASTPEPGADAEVREPPDLPEGFTLTPFLSEEPRRSFEAPEQVLTPGADYQALIETTQGVIRIDLLQDDAPMTVNNFVFLALNRYYDGVVFHRVLEDFMAQTGDPTGTGSGGPGYQFDNEIAPELSHDGPGVVSMANAGPNTNGSQFFITFGEAPWLDGGYNIFGRVVEGEEVLARLQRIDPQTPSAILGLQGTLGELAGQGIQLAGAADMVLEAYLSESLGAVPSQGQTFSVDGYTGVLGRQGQTPAVGFFPRPDVMERVWVIERPKTE